MKSVLLALTLATLSMSAFADPSSACFKVELGAKEQVSNVKSVRLGLTQEDENLYSYLQIKTATPVRGFSIFASSGSCRGSSAENQKCRDSDGGAFTLVDDGQNKVLTIVKDINVWGVQDAAEIPSLKLEKGTVLNLKSVSASECDE